MTSANKNCPPTDSRSVEEAQASVTPSTDRRALCGAETHSISIDPDVQPPPNPSSFARLATSHSVTLPPLAVSPTEAAVMARCSRGFLYKPMRTGELRSFKMGRSRKILYGDLVDWVNSLADRGVER